LSKRDKRTARYTYHPKTPASNGSGGFRTVDKFEEKRVCLHFLYLKIAVDFKVGGYAWEVKDMKLPDDVIPAKGSLNYGSILYCG